MANDNKPNLIQKIDDEAEKEIYFDNNEEIINIIHQIKKIIKNLLLKYLYSLFLKDKIMKEITIKVTTMFVAAVPTINANGKAQIRTGNVKSKLFIIINLLTEK